MLCKIEKHTSHASRKPAGFSEIELRTKSRKYIVHTKSFGISVMNLDVICCVGKMLTYGLRILIYVKNNVISAEEKICLRKYCAVTICDSIFRNKNFQLLKLPFADNCVLHIKCAQDNKQRSQMEKDLERAYQAHRNDTSIYVLVSGVTLLLQFDFVRYFVEYIQCTQLIRMKRCKTVQRMN